MFEEEETLQGQPLVYCAWRVDGSGSTEKEGFVSTAIVHWHSTACGSVFLNNLFHSATSIARPLLAPVEVAACCACYVWLTFTSINT